MGEFCTECRPVGSILGIFCVLRLVPLVNYVKIPPIPSASWKMPPLGLQSFGGPRAAFFQDISGNVKFWVLLFSFFSFMGLTLNKSTKFCTKIDPSVSGVSSWSRRRSCRVRRPRATLVTRTSADSTDSRRRLVTSTTSTRNRWGREPAGGRQDTKNCRQMGK